MLHRITIKNIALIDHAEIDFDAGFNVLTGETGAGKSIIIDSLNLILGERADKNLVRTGTDKAFVEGIFTVKNDEINNKLRSLGIEAEDGLLILSRELFADGRSIARINSHTVTLSALKEITAQLADIHGQHEHQALLNPDNHIHFLDNYSPETQSFKDEVKKHYLNLKEVERKLNQNWGSDEERARRIDILKFQIEEIENSKLAVGEEEELLKEKEQLQNMEKISTALWSAYSLLSSTSEKAGSLDLLQASANELEQIAHYTQEYEKLYNKLETLYYELEDTAGELRHIFDNAELDPARLEEVEDRLALIKNLCRKYGRDIPEVLEFCAKAKNELETIENAAQIIESLNKEKSKITEELKAACEALSNKRKQAAKKLETEIKQQLQELGMKNAEFVINFDIKKDGNGNLMFTESGFDQVEFLFSANLGEPVRPLSKIISGGEMSRFMLAIKNIAAETDSIESMVFDEIDTGISGKMAVITGQKIASIAKHRQVICITHLAPIAALADTHFYIEKSTNGQKTITSVTKLDEEGRIAELARLTGGDNTKYALEHAKEMYHLAQKNK